MRFSGLTFSDVELPPQVPQALKEPAEQAPSLAEETVAEDRATLARAGKTPMASAAMPAEEPVPVIRPEKAEKKSDRAD